MNVEEYILGMGISKRMNLTIHFALKPLVSKLIRIPDSLQVIKI